MAAHVIFSPSDDMPYVRRSIAPYILMEDLQTPCSFCCVAMRSERFKPALMFETEKRVIKLSGECSYLYCGVGFGAFRKPFPILEDMVAKHHR